jgi:hypothetical protein
VTNSNIKIQQTQQEKLKTNCRSVIPGVDGDNQMAILIPLTTSTEKTTADEKDWDVVGAIKVLRIAREQFDNRAFFLEETWDEWYSYWIEYLRPKPHSAWLISHFQRFYQKILDRRLQDDICPSCHSDLNLGRHWPNCEATNYNVPINIRNFNDLCKAEVIVAICDGKRYIIKNRHGASSPYTPSKPDSIHGLFKDAPYYRIIQLRQKS